MLLALPELVPACALDRPVLQALGWLVAGPMRDVEQAAAHAALSARQFHRRVTAAVGYGPKRFQRVHRMQRALSAAPARRGDLAGLASELGYADQAHLCREMLELTGCPPSVTGMADRSTSMSE